MEKPMVYKHLVIDMQHNMLLCTNNLVGIGELVEIHAPDEETPRQACGKTLRKLKDPNIYVVHATYDGHDALGNCYYIGDRSVLRVRNRNRSGMLRRKHPDEKVIVNVEKAERYKERRVVRAKTGSVRRRKKS